RALSASPDLGRLAALRLQFTGLGSDGLRALLSSPALHELRALDLAWNPLGDEAAMVLAAACLPHLSRLGLEETGLGPEGLRALATSAHLTGVRVLDLTGNRVGVRGARHWPLRPTPRDSRPFCSGRMPSRTPGSPRWRPPRTWAGCATWTCRRPRSPR